MIAVDGVPTRFNLLRGNFDASGRFTFGSNVPGDTALIGLELELSALGLDREGRVSESNRQSLRIQ